MFFNIFYRLRICFDQDEGNESKDVEENSEAVESSDSEKPDACDGV